MPAKW
ncbi:hypothetical protein ECPA3_0403, partial [Escherichia coli PA3]